MSGRMSHSRRMYAGTVVIVAMLMYMGMQVGAAPERSLQRLAMHPTTQNDIVRHDDAPRYTMVGSVDVRTRTLQMRQTLAWVNHTGASIRELPFRLYANLSDFAGQTRIQRAFVDGIDTPFHYNLSHSVVTLRLPTAVRHGATGVVTLEYQTSIPRDVGQTKYGAFNDDGRTLSFASAYPLLATWQDGMWHITDPDTKGDLVNSPIAMYDVTLTIPATHQLVSTGTAITQTITGDTRTVRVVSGLQRDFTFVLTTLPVTTRMVDGTRINVYADADEVEGSAQTIHYASRALRLFNAQFGQYPYNELDIVAVDAASFYGVEYPGLLLMQAATVANPSRLERIVVHEVAHQWFYNLVGNDVQTDAWVDEAIATYAQVIYLRAFEGEEAAQSELASFQQQYDNLIERELDGPVDQHMRTYTLYSFNVLAYAKGALFYEALRMQIGADSFARVLQEYVATYRYQIADSDSLYELATNQCTCALDTLYRTWIRP